eukprot:g31258.t1
MECGALVALVLLEPKTFTEEVLGRLKTLKESEKAQMEVALLAAQHVTSDEAVSYLQHALSLARQCRDFLREAEALQQLTELHERMGLWPPRSEWRSACISKLRAASEESVQQQTLQPLLDALHTVEDAGFRVEELLHRKDLQQATASIPSNADWWLRAKAEAGEREPGLTEGNWQGVQPLSMVEVVKEELYRDVRVGGVQYGPRYRQVQGFRPPLKLMSSGKPAVVGVLRPSSEAEETCLSTCGKHERGIGLHRWSTQLPTHRFCVALLHSQIREEDLDVCILMVCSDQYSYTGNFLDQRVDNLDKMLALNVGATTVLCRLFGEDMQRAGRGRILLIGAPPGASLGVAGACAFAGSMAFIRTLSNGLRKEFADTGVGISCMETSTLGRDGSLTQALESTCVGFLVKEGLRDEAVEESPSSSSPPQLEESSEDIDQSWNEEYLRLAQEENFTPLPFAAEIDRFQHAPLSEATSALLVGLELRFKHVDARRVRGHEPCARCVYLGNQRHIHPGLLGPLVVSGPPLQLSLQSHHDAWPKGMKAMLRGLFVMAILAKTSVSMRIADLLSILPFLLRPWVPAVGELELTFLKLIRVQRIYRFFRPKAFKSFLRILLGPEEAQKYESGVREVRPYQLQVLRTFGVVFTLLFITAALFYEAEQEENAQFGDIFSSFYFSTIALSTVGFGDIAPLTPQGRTVITVSVIVGLCLIPSEAWPCGLVCPAASLVAAAISEEQRLLDEKEAEIELAEAERAEAQLAWGAARIAELEDLTREERARVDELEEPAKSWSQDRGKLT